MADRLRNETNQILQRLISQRETTPERVYHQIQGRPGYPPAVTGFKVSRSWEDRGQVIFLLTWFTDPAVRPWISHYRISVVDVEPPTRMLADVERPSSPAVVPLDLVRRTSLRFTLQIVLKSGASSPLSASPVTCHVSPEPRWRAISGDVSALHYPAGFALEAAGSQVGFIAHRQGGGTEMVLRDGTGSGGIDGMGAKVTANGADGSLAAYNIHLIQNPSATAGSQAGYVIIHAGATPYKIPIYNP